MARRVYRPTARSSAFPPVIKNLLIINGLVFMAQLTMGGFLREFFALWPVGTPTEALPRFSGQFWPWQIVTYAFLHGGLGHLFFNMFMLWMFGIQIENEWGSRRFGVFYLLCVLGAGLTQLLVLWGRPTPTVGASGGVFGVMLAFGMMYPNRPIYIYFLFPIKAKWLIVGLIALELFAGFSGSQSGVANFAHLGGAAVGYLLIQYWRGKLPVKPDQRALRW
jgi:membrane associated rhomboid family serine protease